MRQLTNYQTILDHGKPVFVVIPFQEFVKVYPEASEQLSSSHTIPHAVMGLVIKQGYSRIRAWREHLGFTQQEVAARIEITQGALSQIEKPGAKIRKATKEKLAAALGITVDQLS